MSNADRLRVDHCVQVIAPPEGGYRKCSKRAQWFVTDSSERGVCSTHKRHGDYRRIVR
jgi:hypothetical protein